MKSLSQIIEIAKTLITVCKFIKTTAQNKTEDSKHLFITL